MCIHVGVQQYAYTYVRSVYTSLSYKFRYLLIDTRNTLHFFYDYKLDPLCVAEDISQVEKVRYLEVSVDLT